MLQLIRARTTFPMNFENTNVSRGIVDCSLRTHRIALKDNYHRKERVSLHIHLCSSIDWRFEQSILTLTVEKTSSIKKIFLTNLQFVGLLLQRTQTLFSLDCTLKTYSDINRSFLDKLEYSEEFSQTQTLMPLLSVA